MDEVATLHDLDARLRAVEARLGMDRAGTAEPAAAPGDAETFWVLEGLRRRLRGVEDGGVVFAGAVRAAGGHATWQYGLTTETLLAVDHEDAEAAAGRLAALGHPVRLRILLAVLRGRTSPAELAELQGTGTTGQVYHHVRALTAAGWLRSGGRGHVQVPADRVVPLLVALATAL